MPHTTRSIGTAVALMLLLTVASQLLYVSLLSGVGLVAGWPLRSVIWTVELLLFSAITVASIVALVRSSELDWGWSALTVAGLINMIQSGFGLSMFMPATEAGPEFAPLMGTVLAGSFLFYFLAKAIIGVAAISFGMSLFRGDNISGRAVGLATVVAGAMGIILNVGAVHLGLGSVPMAGASGAIATFFAAAAILLNVRGERREPA